MIVKIALCLMAVMSVCATVLAGPIELPDSARPGALRPEQQEAPATVPQAPPAEVIEIPPVIDRPFKLEECPCVVVREFRFLNGEDMPQYGISLAEVQKILDDNLQQQPAQGYSIGQLTEIANAVRAYYREKGLILAQVVLPVQTVGNGVLDMELFIGRLGRVLAEGNKMYSNKVLEAPFQDLIGKPIHKAEIEAALLRLTDFAGLTIFGVFQPGQSIGTADIVLKTQKEKRFDVAFRADNHGTRETGQNRFRTVIDWNNPTGGSDKLTGMVQQSYHEKNSHFNSIEYSRYLFDRTYLLEAYIDNSAFDVGGDLKNLQIHNETEKKQISLSKSFKRSRIENISGSLELTREKSYARQFGQQISVDRLAFLTFGVDYDSVDNLNIFRAEEGGGGINFLSVELSQGFNDFLGSTGSNEESMLLPVTHQPGRGGRGGRLAEGEFTKFFATFTRLQTVRKNINLLFRADVQWSADLLASLEQYSVGGPDNVRAFPVAQTLWDRAFFYSIEFLFNAPFFADRIAFQNRTWGELLQLAVFYDSASGRVNSPLATERDGYDTLKGAGIGLRFNVPGSIESRVFWAWEIGGDSIGTCTPAFGCRHDKRPAIWGDITYSF